MPLNFIVKPRPPGRGREPGFVSTRRAKTRFLTALGMTTSKSFFRSPLAVASSILLAMVPAQAQVQDTLQDLNRLRVQVLISDPLAGTNSGSGFWISSEGLVVTCWRNLSQNPDGVVTVRGAATAGQLLQGRLLAFDIQKNLAIIKVYPNPFARADSNSGRRDASPRVAIPALNPPQIGQKLFVIAARPGRADFAAAERSVVDVRPVSELGRELKILLTGVTQFGDAGEPVIDKSGQVIGILEGPYPSADRTKWGATEVVIPIQPALDLLKQQ